CAEHQGRSSCPPDRQELAAVTRRYHAARDETRIPASTTETSDPTSTPRIASSRTPGSVAKARQASSSETENPEPPRAHGTTRSMILSAGGLPPDPILIAIQPNSVMPMILPTGSATEIAKKAGDRSAGATAGITTNAAANAKTGRIAPLTQGSSTWRARIDGD